MVEKQKELAIQQYKKRVQELESKLHEYSTQEMCMQHDITMLEEEKELAFQTTNSLSKENKQLKELIEAIEKDASIYYRESKSASLLIPSVSNTTKEWAYRNVVDMIKRHKEEYNYETR